MALRTSKLISAVITLLKFPRKFNCWKLLSIFAVCYRPCCMNYENLLIFFFGVEIIYESCHYTINNSFNIKGVKMSDDIQHEKKITEINLNWLSSKNEMRIGTGLIFWIISNYTHFQWTIFLSLWVFHKINWNPFFFISSPNSVFLYLIALSYAYSWKWRIKSI